MKIVFVLQVCLIIHQNKADSSLYGFGYPSEDYERIRIYLDDDEKLLVPKDSKVDYINPINSEASEEEYFESGPTFPTYITKVAKKPSYAHSFYSKATEKPYFTLEDLNVKSAPVESHFGGYLGGYAPSYRKPKAGKYRLLTPQVTKQPPASLGKFILPIFLLPNAWTKGVNLQESEQVKPVTEHLEDDLKYDFRTKTHSLR
ncbi:hypothetical protein D910_07773 [Dendroctonus ponderosae]|uniref:Uncharacterized protein n=1 Tax=Dendroctonus ponderosae TaxID=77166 RepID=U4TZ76_DENPD|nr:hypothetical protein D910_00730 [Dendroctonus ponderosae]ERL87937.1 hypothetical protein D910_05325 [Dendroctonus ponderosae]ERL90424.1 hypothetical protein D910_07773 [Dendroctonus ponderosae]